jgi:hypothetical protein
MSDGGWNQRLKEECKELKGGVTKKKGLKGECRKKKAQGGVPKKKKAQGGVQGVGSRGLQAINPS